MRVWSWNVNGIRACAKRGLLKWLRHSEADIVGLQEVRARWDQLTRAQRSPGGLWSHISAAEQAGYSGVGLYAVEPPDAVRTSLGEARFDREGRVQIARWGRLVVANVYFPNGSGPNRDHSRIPYKLDFYAALLEVLQAERDAGHRVLVMGDFNTAHRPIDLARPSQNKNTSGFTAPEREVFDRWLEAGWVDTFRHFHPEAEGRYSWWSQRRGVRQRNVGWRIDYVLAADEALEFVQGAHIADEVKGSDHCPVGVELDPAIVGEAVNNAASEPVS